MTAAVATVNSWQFWGLLLAVFGLHVAAIDFNVFEACGGVLTTGASAPQCRRETAAASLSKQQTVGVSAVPQQLPVDMRLPCGNEDIECHENVDVVRTPAIPKGPSIESCSHSLMPWSPFPCTYNTDSSFGVPDQTTDYCYTTPAPSAVGNPSTLATNLTTDGYHNVYFGMMPNSWCSKGKQIDKLLLTLDFRLASGRQFDRTYSFQIGKAVAAFGTCSEPSRLIKADKYWSVTVDITHLQSYIKEGMFTRFSLSNIVSNTYNVPIWVKAELHMYNKHPEPSRVLKAQGALGSSLNPKQPLVQSHTDMNQVDISGKSGHSKGRLDSEMNSESGIVTRNRATSKQNALQDEVASALAADVASEVLPLWSQGESGAESLSSVAGNGLSPEHWPNVTFALPEQLSDERTIYRAQLLVVPKANGCEEFWAMNPPDPETNSTCNGVSTGQPYREVRVYVDGQLAGFYPIFYTMYTGGVDPRLWTAIVAPYAHSLPVYTFDLGPWLGALNTPVTFTPNSKPHSITVEVFGATGSNWLLANTLLIWRSSDESQLQVLGAGQPKVFASPSLLEPAVSDCKGDELAVVGDCVTSVGSRMLSVETMLKIGTSFLLSSVSYELNSYSNRITYNNTAGTASWDQKTVLKAAWFTGLQHSKTSSQSRAARKRSGGNDLQAPPKNRVLVAAPSRTSQGPSSKQSSAKSSRSVANDLNTGRFVLTQNARQYDWLVVGGIYPKAPYVFGFDEALLAPTVYGTPDMDLGSKSGASKSALSTPVIFTGKQHLLQQSVMVNVYDTKKPACPEPKQPTHSAVLHSTIGPSGDIQKNNQLCESWTAACAFCSPSLLVNAHNVTQCSTALQP